MIELPCLSRSGIEGNLFRYKRKLHIDVVGKELCHKFGGELGDVEYEVVVAGIVT